VFGRRSAIAALDQPALPAAMGEPPGPGPSPVPPPETRAALWRLAGLERSEAGLTELADDPFPLARMVAACALARRESRGAHQRADYPDTDPALDLTHSVVNKSGAIPRSETWR
jgi:L-aspartate oxidase